MLRPGQAVSLAGVAAVTLGADSLLDHVVIGGGGLLRVGEVWYPSGQGSLTVFPAGPRLALSWQSVSAERWTATVCLWEAGEAVYPVGRLADRRGWVSCPADAAVPTSPPPTGAWSAVIYCAGARRVAVQGGATAAGQFDAIAVTHTRLADPENGARIHPTSQKGLTLPAFSGPTGSLTRGHWSLLLWDHLVSASGGFEVGGVDEIWICTYNAPAGATAELAWEVSF